MSVHSQQWFLPDSTHAVVARLSQGRRVNLSSDVEQLVLRRLVDQRDCPLCMAPAGTLCDVYGGVSTLMRTHPIRLRLTRAEREAVINWALRKSARRAPDAPGPDSED